jgi:hypothetical protein
VKSILLSKAEFKYKNKKQQESLEEKMRKKHKEIPRAKFEEGINKMRVLIINDLTAKLSEWRVGKWLILIRVE